LPDHDRENASPRPAVITVGDELLFAERENGNQATLLRALYERGYPAAVSLSLPDEVATIARWIGALVRDHAPILVAGGIGGTHDDCTRQGIAAGLGRALELHPECDALLAARYGERYTPQRRRMAELPAGCALIPNPDGAPGFSCDGVHAFPGFPRMLRPMLATVLDTLLPGPPRTPVTVERTLALREGDIAMAVEAFGRAHPTARIGIYPSNDAATPQLTLRLRMPGEDPELRAAFAALVSAFPGQGGAGE